MSTTPSLTTHPLRRLAVTVALAGVAGLGSIAAAPVASAAGPDAPTAQSTSAAPAPQAVDGPNSVVDRSGGNGPDAFLVLEHGRKPVFFCETDGKKPKKNCVAVDAPTRY